MRHFGSLLSLVCVDLCFSMVDSDEPVFLGITPTPLRHLYPSLKGFFNPDLGSKSYYYDFSSDKSLLNFSVDVVTVETRADKFPDYVRDVFESQIQIPPAERVIVLRDELSPDFLPKLSRNQRIKDLNLYDFITEASKVDPDRLVIILDSDVLWLNCETDFSKEYLKFVERHRKEDVVVFGADLNEFQSPIQHEQWRYPEAPLNTAGFTDLGQLKFLNAGFFIGTYSAVSKLANQFIRCLFTFQNLYPGLYPQFERMDSCDRKYFGNEQGIFHHLFLNDYGTDNQSIFLDYEQVFVFNQLRFQLDKTLSVHTPANGRHYVTNNWIARELDILREVCFLHFPGTSGLISVVVSSLKNPEKFKLEYKEWIINSDESISEKIYDFFARFFKGYKFPYYSESLPWSHLWKFKYPNIGNLINDSESYVNLQDFLLSFDTFEEVVVYFTPICVVVLIVGVLLFVVWPFHFSKLSKTKKEN